MTYDDVDPDPGPSCAPVVIDVYMKHFTGFSKLRVQFKFSMKQLRAYFLSTFFKFRN